jgi:4-hydroxybenzoate polyprenyltransferase/phosphoserine phosphatase
MNDLPATETTTPISGSAGTTPLVVDLDGTLIKTDLLVETANHFVTHRLLSAPSLLVWLARGRAVMKAELAERAAPDPATLPYHAPLLDWLKTEKATGRRMVLATASHRKLATAVADHLGLFDEVLATEGSVNLKAERKRDLLVTRFGQGGFDYVGNDAADLPVWAAARQAHVVGASSTVLAMARSQGPVDRVFDTERMPGAAALLKCMRPHQWMKNLLIVVPLLSAHRYGDVQALWATLWAFIAFGLCASSVYVLNDLVDVGDDRHHASKRRRPFASGQLSLLVGWVAWPTLLMLSFLLALATLPLTFAAVLAGYLVITMAYSLRFKQYAILDVLLLAGLYTIRIFAGAAAIAVPLSFWLLTFSLFIFLSLALMKRYSELRPARHRGEAGKLRGRGYQHDDLDMVASFGSSSGYLSVLVLALYIQGGEAAQLYQTPRVIWLACPLMLFWISRAWLIAHRGLMHDDPIVFAIKDRVSWFTGAGLAAIFAASGAVT